MNREQLKRYRGPSKAELSTGKVIMSRAQLRKQKRTKRSQFKRIIKKWKKHTIDYFDL